MTDDKKPPRPDPFAPLPLSEALTGPTSAPAPAPVSAPEPEPPVMVEATAYEPEPEPEPEPHLETQPEPPAPQPEPEPIPPPAPIVVENELRDAIGATRLPDEPKKAKKEKIKKRAATDDGDEDDDRPRSRLWMFVAALTIMAGGGIAAMILVGRSNSERYILACEADRVVIQQGRSFPPWGETELEGAEWKPMKIPAEAPCAAFETKSKALLAEKFEHLLEERAKILVGGGGGKTTPTTVIGPEDPVAKVDEAEANLKQALLVARHLATDSERNARREDLQRYLGDVTYWRASARLRAAIDALADAAKQFDTAAIQNPRARRDAKAWGTFTHGLADELRAGPPELQEKDATYVPAPTEPVRPTSAPLGVALPVEPPTQEGSAAPPPPAVDAGVPAGGGVLL